MLLFSVLSGGKAAAQEQHVRVISLEEALEIALQQNTSLLRSEEQVLLAETDVGERRASFLPQLSFSTSGSQSYGRTFSLEEGAFINRRTEFMSIGTSASMTLFDGFRRFAELDQARRQAEARDETLSRTRQEVLHEVAGHFLDLAERKALVAIREEELELRRTELARIEDLIRAGTRSTTERYPQQVSVAEAEQQLLTAERNLDRTRNQLVETLALDPYASYRFEAPALEAEQLDSSSAPLEALAVHTPPDPELEALVEEAFRQRPDLQARRLELQAARQGIRATERGRWPTLSLSAGYNSGWSSVAQRPLPDGAPGETYHPSFFEQLDNRRSGSVSLGLSLPLFDRGQTHRQRQRAQVQIRTAEYDIEDLERQIAREVRDAHADWETARRQVEVAAQRLEAAERAREAAEEDYRLGTASLVELTQASTNRVQAASGLVQARYQALRDELYLAYLRGVLDVER